MNTSFGFSIGDFIALGRLSLPLYASYRDGLEEVHQVSRELLSLHVTLKELRWDLEDPVRRFLVRAVERQIYGPGLFAAFKGPLG